MRIRTRSQQSERAAGIVPRTSVYKGSRRRYILKELEFTTAKIFTRLQARFACNALLTLPGRVSGESDIILSRPDDGKYSTPRSRGIRIRPAYLGRDVIIQNVVNEGPPHRPPPNTWAFKYLLGFRKARGFFKGAVSRGAEIIIDKRALYIEITQEGCIARRLFDEAPIP